MADLKKRVPEDVPGDFFVDSTCIDCDTCRQLAPAVFKEAADHAFVHQQPTTPEDRRRALQALVCCPTGSIGCLGDDRPASVMDDFPLLIEEPVYYCGFTSPKSYDESPDVVEAERLGEDGLGPPPNTTPGGGAGRVRPSRPAW